MFEKKIDLVLTVADYSMQHEPVPKGITNIQQFNFNCLKQISLVLKKQIAVSEFLFKTDISGAIIRIPHDPPSPLPEAQCSCNSTQTAPQFSKFFLVQILPEFLETSDK